MEYTRHNIDGLLVHPCRTPGLQGLIMYDTLSLTETTQVVIQINDNSIVVRHLDEVLSHLNTENWIVIPQNKII